MTRRRRNVPLEPADHAEYRGHPNPHPPLGMPVELVPPSEPATPGGGTGSPYRSRPRRHAATRSAIIAFSVFRRLAAVGRTLDPLTYLASGLLIAIAFVAVQDVVPAVEVHTRLVEASWRTGSLGGSSAGAALFAYLKWLWEKAIAHHELIALLTS